MIALLLILLPILFLDVLNPLLLASVIYALQSSHPIRNSFSLLFSFHTSYFVAGFLITVGLHYFTVYHGLPQGFHYLLGFVVGILLIYFAWRQYYEGYENPEENIDLETSLNIWTSLKMGLKINLIDLPYAIPYLGAMVQILLASLTAHTTIIILIGYNILYSLPFLATIFIYLFNKSQSEEVFKNANARLGWFSQKIRPILGTVIGVFFLNQSITYFFGS